MEKNELRRLFPQAPWWAECQVLTGTLEAVEAGQLVLMTGEAGRWVMNCGEETVYLTLGGEHFRPDSLTPGETLTVCRSPITTRSLPPQSPAFAVLRH